MNLLIGPWGFPLVFPLALRANRLVASRFQGTARVFPCGGKEEVFVGLGGGESSWVCELLDLKGLGVMISHLF